MHRHGIAPTSVPGTLGRWLHLRSPARLTSTFLRPSPYAWLCRFAKRQTYDFYYDAKLTSSVPTIACLPNTVNFYPFRAVPTVLRTVFSIHMKVGKVVDHKEQ